MQVKILLNLQASKEQYKIIMALSFNWTIFLSSLFQFIFGLGEGTPLIKYWMYEYHCYDTLHVMIEYWNEYFHSCFPIHVIRAIK